MTQTSLKNKKGFTIIELLVVIAVVALLSSIILGSLSKAAAKGRDAKRISDLQSIAAGLELYYQDNGAYPTTYNGGPTSAPSIACLSVGNWCWGVPGDTKWFLSSKYMPTMPVDPQNFDNGYACNAGNPPPQALLYSYYSDGQNFVLATHLEAPVPQSDSHYYTGTYGCTAYADWAITNGL